MVLLENSYSLYVFFVAHNNREISLSLLQSGGVYAANVHNLQSITKRENGALQLKRYNRTTSAGITLNRGSAALTTLSFIPRITITSLSVVSLRNCHYTSRNSERSPDKRAFYAAARNTREFPNQ